MKITTPISRLLLGFMTLLLALTGYAQSTDLMAIRINHPSPKIAEVELAFDKPATFKYFTLENPYRVVIDIANINNTSFNHQIDWFQSPITSMRLGKQQDGSLRIVLDLSTQTPMQVQHITSGLGDSILVDLVNPPEINNVHRLQNLSIAPIAKPTAPTVTATALSSPPNKPSNTQTPVAISAPPPHKQKVMVVIDAGHGGKDPGASGSKGESEKDVVLAISQDLYRILNNQPGIDAVMTRHGDYYLTLRERLQIAREANADVFIAIHADAYDNPYSHGASVYALSLKGASSEAARWLAEKENYSELGGVNLNGKGDMLRSVLIDLSQTATISSSLVLGQAILSHLGQLGPLHHGDKVEQAPFVVLKSPDIPSVLVETGFISNPDEAEHLEDPVYQQQVATAIAQGLSTYFHELPPTGA